MVRELIEKALNGTPLSAEETHFLFALPLFSDESALVLAASRRKSDRAAGGLAEVHAQVGLNAGPCACRCAFCSFSHEHGIFTEQSELPLDEAIAAVRQFERDGANAIYLMATAQYPFDRFIDRARRIRAAIDPATVLVANVGDSTLEQYQQLKDAGFAGIYHAVRMGEGRDTPLDPARRRESMRLARQAGLIVGTCVEPVGPEHTVEELVEKTLITREVGPCFSGAARRITIPGTRLAEHGMVSEARMAHILAVVRLALGDEVPGNCTHEPSIIGAAAGANLLWAEVGSNPRDTVAETAAARGMSVADCRKIFAEAECPVLDGPSRFFAVRETVAA